MTNEELGELYERYGYLVHRRCATLLGDAQDANDALQETFLRVQRYPPGEVTSMLGWLYAVAVRVCFDQLARQRRPTTWADQVLHTAKEWLGASAPDRVISMETRLSLGQALLGLDEKSRQIALLYFLEGLTQEEIAARTGYSRRTIVTKLQRLEVALRELFADAGALASGGAA